MTNTLQAGLLFLVTTIFNLYLFVLMTRLLLVFVGANYFDPITQFIIKLTDFMVKPIRRYIPNFHRIEVATLLLIIVLELIKFLMTVLLTGLSPNIIGLIILTLGDALRILLDTLFYAIFLQVILSWVQPYSPVNRILALIISPIMRPIQKRIPPVGGIDISPIFAIIGLQFINLILVQSLIVHGWSWMTG